EENACEWPEHEGDGERACRARDEPGAMVPAERHDGDRQRRQIEQEHAQERGADHGREQHGRDEPGPDAHEDIATLHYVVPLLSAGLEAFASADPEGFHRRVEKGKGGAPRFPWSMMGSCRHRALNSKSSMIFSEKWLPRFRVMLRSF